MHAAGQLERDVKIVNIKADAKESWWASTETFQNSLDIFGHLSATVQTASNFTIFLKTANLI